MNPLWNMYVSFIIAFWYSTLSPFLCGSCYVRCCHNRHINGQHPFPSRLHEAPSGLSPKITSSILKLTLPSSITKQGTPMDPFALTESKAELLSRKRMNSLRFLTCSPISISWYFGLSWSCSFTWKQSGQVAITYTLIIIQLFTPTHKVYFPIFTTSLIVNQSCLSLHTSISQPFTVDQMEQK